MQGGTEKLSDDETEVQLEKVVKLLAYISDKDLFSSFYQKKLSRRLLNDMSASDELERFILGRLKQQCGSQFTSRVPISPPRPLPTPSQTLCYSRHSPIWRRREVAWR